MRVRAGTAAKQPGRRGRQREIAEDEGARIGRDLLRVARRVIALLPPRGSASPAGSPFRSNGRGALETDVGPATVVVELPPHGERTRSQARSARISLTVQDGVVTATLDLTGRNIPVTLESMVRDAGLTEREIDVVELALEGLSNRGIGRRLEISPITVNWHLKHGYRKMGIEGRQELAAILLGLRPPIPSYHRPIPLQRRRAPMPRTQAAEGPLL